MDLGLLIISSGKTSLWYQKVAQMPKICSIGNNILVHGIKRHTIRRLVLITLPVQSLSNIVTVQHNKRPYLPCKVMACYIMHVGSVMNDLCLMFEMFVMSAIWYWPRLYSLHTTSIHTLINFRSYKVYFLSYCFLFQQTPGDYATHIGK